MNFERTWDTLTEFYDLDVKHKEFNIDAFENGTCSYLFITGLSGSGKSTVADRLIKKYKCDYIELDNLNLINFFSSADLYKFSRIYKNFFKKYPGYERTFNKDGLIADRLAVQFENKLITKEEYEKIDKRLTDFRNKLMQAFLKYLMTENEIQCIVDGVDIGYNQELFTGAEPMVIITVPVEKASEQAYERDVVAPTKAEYKKNYKKDYKDLEKSLNTLLGNFNKQK